MCLSVSMNISYIDNNNSYSYCNLLALLYISMILYYMPIFQNHSDTSHASAGMTPFCAAPFHKMIKDTGDCRLRKEPPTECCCLQVNHWLFSHFFFCNFVFYGISPRCCYMWLILLISLLVCGPKMCPTIVLVIFRRALSRQKGVWNCQKAVPRPRPKSWWSMAATLSIGWEPPKNGSLLNHPKPKAG